MHSCSSPIFIKIKYLGYEAQLRVRLEELGLKVLPLLNMCLVMRAPPLYDTVVRCFRRGFFLGVKGEAITGSGTLEVVLAFNTFGLLLFRKVSSRYFLLLLLNPEMPTRHEFDNFLYLLDTPMFHRHLLDTVLILVGYLFTRVHKCFEVKVSFFIIILI